MCAYIYIYIIYVYVSICIYVYVAVMPFYPCTLYFAQRLMKEGRRKEDKEIKEGKINLEQLDLVVTRLYDT